MNVLIAILLLAAGSTAEPVAGAAGDVIVVSTNVAEIATNTAAGVAVGRAKPKTKSKSKGGTAKITSGTAYYDRKEGYAYFSDKVFVDDAEYQLHADRAYVFMDGTNSLKRVVALGHVAITNGTKRAYGEKASYYRQSGMIVLSASDEIPAEVRDEAKGGDQVVRGKKIKFWTGSQQVEVQSAWISAPKSGGMKDSLKNVLGR